MDLTEEIRAMRKELTALRDHVTRLNTPTEYLNTKQLAAYLGLSVDVLTDWRRDRRGPPFVQSSSRFVRYRRSDVDAWAIENLVEM